MKLSCCLPLVVLLLMGPSGCGPFPDPRSVYAGDLQSPIFVAAAAVSQSTFHIEFGEPVTPDVDDYSCLPDRSISAVSATDHTVRVELAEPMAPGAEYALYGRVHDRAGNSMKFITKLYGFNPAVPQLRINEFTTQGSGKHPDCVELFVETAGNLAGVCVYEGTDEEWEQRLVFPSLEVSPGDFVVVHFKPEGLPGEVDEVSNPALSDGYDTSDTGRDFWVPQGEGLSGNNGVITVYASPGGPLIDAVLYSNRTSTSDDRYAGFGSRRTLEQAEYLAACGEWLTADERVRPEDAVNPDPSTGTRSICRVPGPDTNGKDDWYVVPTRGVTFGLPNVLERYTP